MVSEVRVDRQPPGPCAVVRCSCGAWTLAAGQDADLACHHIPAATLPRDELRRPHGPSPTRESAAPPWRPPAASPTLPPAEQTEGLLDPTVLDEIELLLDLIEVGTRSGRHLTPSEVDAALRVEQTPTVPPTPRKDPE